MPPSPTLREPGPMAAFDARDIVTVQDAHGGLTVYFQDRPTHYLLDGEWYRAVPLPGGAAPRPAPEREATPA
ncbi:MAG: hypothetical protein OXG35_25240 [Acidobacteria bacterium]|nr:hypothetical protein [Acidobacteriota bacterium]